MLSQTQINWIYKRNIEVGTVNFTDNCFWYKETLDANENLMIQKTMADYLQFKVIDILPDNKGKEMCLIHTINLKKNIELYITKECLEKSSWRAIVLSWIFIVPFMLMYNLLRKPVIKLKTKMN